MVDHVLSIGLKAEEKIPKQYELEFNSNMDEKVDSFSGGNSHQLTEMIDTFFTTFHNFYAQQAEKDLIAFCHQGFKFFKYQINFEPKLPSSFEQFMLEFITLLFGNNIELSLKFALIHLLREITGSDWFPIDSLLEFRCPTSGVCLVQALAFLVTPNSDDPGRIFDLSNINILSLPEEVTSELLPILANLAAAESPLVSHIYSIFPLRSVFPLRDRHPVALQRLIYNLTQYPIPEEDQAEIIGLDSRLYERFSDLLPEEISLVVWTIKQFLELPTFPAASLLETPLPRLLVDALSIDESPFQVFTILGAINSLTLLQKDLGTAFSPFDLAQNFLIPRRLKALLTDEAFSNTAIRLRCAELIAIVLLAHPDQISLFVSPTDPGADLDALFELQASSDFNTKRGMTQLLVAIALALPLHLQIDMTRRGLLADILEFKGGSLNPAVDLLQGMVIAGASAVIEDCFLEQDMDLDALGEFIADPSSGDHDERTWANQIKNILLQLPKVNEAFWSSRT